MMRKATAVLTAICCLFASQASALGLGSLTLESSLNQPLRARIEIVDLGGVSSADIVVQMGSQQDFQRFNLDRTNFFSDVDFTVENTSQGVFVVLTSNQSVREPYLSFILDTRWPSGRILSEHTVLLDLPVFSDGRSVAEPINQPVSPVLDTEPGIESQAPAGTSPAASESVTAELTEVAEVEEVDRSEAVEAESQVAPEPEPEATGATLSQGVVTDAPITPDSLEVLDSDTLWEVALRVRPDSSVSIQQTMLAIQRLNPDAFAGGNINRLISGETLQVPDLSQIQSINQQQAVSEVTRQNQQADLSVQPLTAPAAGPSSLAATEQQGQLRVLTAEEAEPVGTGASAAVEAENAELDARIQALENQLALQEEEVDRAELQRAELLARLGDLDDQIASAMEIIRLQDQQLAQLQQSLAEAAVQASLQQEQIATQVEQAVASPAGSEPVRTAPPSFVQSIATVLNNNSMILVIVSVLVVLLMVMLLMRRNRVVSAEGLEVEFEGGLIPDDSTESAADFVADHAASEEPADEEFEPEELEPEHFEEVAELASASFVDDEEQEVVVEEELDQSVSEFTYDADDGSEEGLDQDAETEIQLYDSGEADPEIVSEPESALEPAEPPEEKATSEESAESGQAELAEVAAGSVAEIDELADQESVDDGNQTAETEEIEPESLTSEQEAPVETEEPDVVVDFELDTDAEGVDAEEPETAEVDFDIDEFLDEEEDIELQQVAEQSHTDDLTADPEDAVDFELDTEAEDLEPDAVQSESPDAELEEIEFSDGMDESAGSIDADSDEDGDADSGMDLDTFDLEQDKSLEEGGESVSADDEIESLEFEAGGAATGETLEEAELDIESVSDAEVETLDFELDEEATTREAEEELEPESETSESVDFELGSESEEESTVTELDNLDEADDDQGEVQEEVEELDFVAFDESGPDLEAEAADDTEIEQPDEEADSQQPVEGEAEDSELLEAEAIDSVTLADAENVEEVEDIEFTDEQEEPAAPELEEELGELDFLSADNDSAIDDADLESELLPNDDEAATKLDLAYAYQKMGDFDGAKEILEEVVKEGNDAQVSEAKILIDTLEQ